MYFFIAIIFIAELIVTANIIKLIWKADIAVLKLNDDVSKAKGSIKESLIKFRKNIHCIETSVNCLVNYVNKKREEYILKIIKNILMYLLIFIIETKFCKTLRAKKWCKRGKPFLKRLLA